MKRLARPLAGVLLALSACTAGDGEDEDTTSTATATATATGGESTTSTSTSGASASTAGESTTSATTTGTTAASTSTSAGTTTGDLTTGDLTSTGDTDETTTGEPPPEPAAHYVGRADLGDPPKVRLGWSGVGVVFRFTGTGATVHMDDKARYHTVVVDGAVQPTLATTPGDQAYVVAAGLADGEHTVEVYRRTEGSFGATVYTGVEIEGELLAPPPVTRRLEIIGDSITCGYGDEGEAPCSFSAETENHYLTYGAVAARALGAELRTIAWSGKGVIYNYGDDKTDPLPAIYDRAIAVDVTPVSDAWEPDAVIINLGTNDFSTGDDPSEAMYTGAYLDFLVHLRERYPDAFILLLQPTLFGNEATMVAGYLESVVDARHADGDAAVGYADVNVDWIGSGCDGHPSVATHAGMADELVAALEAELGW